MGSDLADGGAHLLKSASTSLMSARSDQLPDPGWRCSPRYRLGHHIHKKLKVGVWASAMCPRRILASFFLLGQQPCSVHADEVEGREPDSLPTSSTIKASPANDSR